MNKDLTEQIDNLTPKGVALLVPFFKEVVTEETNNYTAVDGYQCAVLSMNLTIYLKVKLTMEDKSTELNPSDLNFVKSFEVILQDQEEIITKSFGKF